MVLKAKTTRRDSDQKNLALDEAVREETIRLNAEIPLSLHKQVKIRAVEEGSNMTTLVIKSLHEYLSR